MHLSRRVFLAIGAGILLIVGYLGYGRVFATQEEQSSAQPVPVNRGTLRLTVISAGILKPPRAADLSFRSSGVVEEVSVQTGDIVEKGQPLAKLETRPLEFQLALAEIALKTAELNLETLLVGARPEDIASANASLAAARQKLARMVAQGEPEDTAASEASLQGARAKLDQLLIPSSDDIGAAEQGVLVAQANLKSAQAKLDQLLHPSAADLAKAESDLVSAQTKLDQLRNPSPADVATAQAAVDSARASLQNAQANLDELNTPPPEEIASAQVAVATAEDNLASAATDLRQLQLILSDNQIRSLVEAYQQLYDARERLSGDRARSAPIDEIAADEAAVLRALRTLEIAERDFDYPQAGVTAKKIRSAETAVHSTRIALDNARLKLDKLLSPAESDVNAAENAFTSAQASLRSAQAKLDKLLRPSPADLAAADSAVTSVQAKLDQLGNPSPADIAAAESTMVAAQANLQSAQRKLDQLINPGEADLAAAGAAVLQAENQLKKTRLPYTEADLASQRASVEQALAQLSRTANPSTAQDIAKSQLSVERAQLDVEQARFDLEHAVLVAPFDGIISNVAVTPGASQGVGASTIVMSLIETTVMHVQASVDETDVAKIELEQDAFLTVDAIRERPYRGKVIAIAPSAREQSGVITYEVTLSVSRPQMLKAGMTAVVNILYEERQDVLLVPLRAITRSGREQSVQVLVNGEPQTRIITTGLSDDQRTEVIEGLQEGDRVLVEGLQRGVTTGRIPGQGSAFQGAGPGGFGGGSRPRGGR